MFVLVTRRDVWESFTMSRKKENREHRCPQILCMSNFPIAMIKMAACPWILVSCADKAWGNLFILSIAGLPSRPCLLFPVIMDDVEDIVSFLMEVASHIFGHLVSCIRVMLWSNVASQSHPVHFQAIPPCCGLQRLFVLQYEASFIFFLIYPICCFCVTFVCQ